MRRAPLQSGVDVNDSEDAGRSVCESAYWSLLTYAHSPGLTHPTSAAFLHVPHESNEYSIERIATAVRGVVDARRAMSGTDGSVSGSSLTDELAQTPASTRRARDT